MVQQMRKIQTKHYEIDHSWLGASVSSSRSRMCERFHRRAPTCLRLKHLWLFLHFIVRRQTSTKWTLNKFKKLIHTHAASRPNCVIANVLLCRLRERGNASRTIQFYLEFEIKRAAFSRAPFKRRN